MYLINLFLWFLVGYISGLLAWFIRALRSANAIILLETFRK